MGGLHRKLDRDLIERIEASGSIIKVKPSVKVKREPRAWHTYRHAKRNVRRLIRAKQLEVRRAGKSYAQDVLSSFEHEKGTKFIQIAP